MENQEQLLNEFKSWIPFVQELKQVEERIWNEPLGEGKWSIRGVVSHIMLWDKHYNEVAIERIAKQEPITLKQHADFNIFNAEANSYGQTISIQELVQQTIEIREQILHHIKNLTEEQLEGNYIDSDGNPFTIEEYLKDFVSHDQHHREQIKVLMSLSV